MNLYLLLISLSICATIGAFRPKRDGFLKFHGHQISENTDSQNDQDDNGQHETPKRSKQLMRLIANMKVDFWSIFNIFYDRYQVDGFVNYYLVIWQTECVHDCINKEKCKNKAKSQAGFQTYFVKLMNCLRSSQKWPLFDANVFLETIKRMMLYNIDLFWLKINWFW